MSLRVVRALVALSLLNVPAAAATGFIHLPGSERPLRVTGSELLTCIHFSDIVIRSRSKAPAAGTAVVLRGAGSGTCGRRLQKSRPIPGRDPSYFLGKSGNYLIFDIGTGPSQRQLLLYDFRQAKVLLEESYGGPVHVENGVLKFWVPAGKQADPANCPQFDKIRNDGFTPALEQLTSVDLAGATPVRVVGVAVRCNALQ